MKNKNKKIIEESADLIEALLDSGHDEDAHWWGFNHRTISGEDILNLLQDIDAVDNVMEKVRPLIMKYLRESAENYIKESGAKSL